MINLFDYSLSSLEELMLKEGQKKYRATQLFSWLYVKKVYDFDLMSDISKSFRDVLKDKFTLNLPTIDTYQISNDGTIKCLIGLNDGHKVETVLMPYNYGNAICISTQVGCNMGCSFCASGLLGKHRNLSPSEMVGQVLLMNDLLIKLNRYERVSHVVVMGTGEPFDNYDNVMEFIRIINAQKGLAIGARHITVSTCGLIEGIKKYAREGLQTNLAISLHASNDETRKKLMKVANIYSLKDIIDAVKEYESIAGRRVTYEYLLLQEVNDNKEDATNLINLIKGTLGYVNLIPYNETNLCDYKRSSNNRVHAFLDYLIKGGVNATIRKEFGSDIDAACGQLRARSYLKDEK